MLFPFDLGMWMHGLSNAFPAAGNKGVNRYLLEQSYFYLQVGNLYMINFARNREWMYLDLKDFEEYLTKFNFIRFFHSFSRNNEFIATKYSERLIKTIKWRTSESEKYLLMLIRSSGWERFILHIQDFCRCYELLDSHKDDKSDNDN